VTNQITIAKRPLIKIIGHLNFRWPCHDGVHVHTCYEDAQLVINDGVHVHTCYDDAQLVIIEL
jgi:hypothetical protein